MSITKFDNITRSALWNSYNNICFYCSRPLNWDELHIDHIIPESLGIIPEKIEEIKIEFGLEKDFYINTLYNLVPSHAKCNLRKNDELFPKQTNLFYFGLTKRTLPKIIAEIEKLKRRKNKGQIISKLQSALASKLIDIKELQIIINQSQQNDWDLKEIRLPSAIEFLDEVYESFYYGMDSSFLLDKKLSIGGTTDYIELVNDNGEVLKVATLREWRNAVKSDFYPLTNYYIKLSSNFTFLDELLDALEKAKMPKISFISEPWLEIDNLDFLSPNILLDYEDKLDKYIKEGLSIGDLVRKGVVNISETTFYKISLEFDGMETSLIEQFRADFNNNGVEDIFVRGWAQAVGGSLGYGFTTIFTRYSEKHLIEEVK